MILNRIQIFEILLKNKMFQSCFSFASFFGLNVKLHMLVSFFHK